MPPRPSKKRLGKKHRQASTRPKKGRAPRATPATGAITKAAPKKRKAISSRHAEAEQKKRTPTRSPEREARKPIASDRSTPARRPSSQRGLASTARDSGHLDSDSPAELAAWQRAEALAEQMHLPAPAPKPTRAPGAPGLDSETWEDSPSNREPRTADLPLIAICGRPNVGKSTLFNRLTGTRRSIVGDEPGITRDRIYADIEWLGRRARLVDTGGVLPNDPELIPAEIFRQAQVALTQANVVVMVVDGRTELASPDLELARLLLRSGKPVFLAVNKIDTAALAPSAENFRRLGFANVIPISAEHGAGIGDLLDQVFDALPEPAPSIEPGENKSVILSGARSAQSKDPEAARPTAAAKELLATDHDLSPRTLLEPRTSNLEPAPSSRHADFVPHETRIAIIGRPNVGKSTLLNVLTGSDRAIVSPIAGTTRDAVDELITHNGQQLRFVDTAGIRRKGKTRLMAEKLSVVMARRHLEAADLSLLLLDATEGVTALDANIGGYAHESGRSVIIVVNKWDLVANAAAPAPNPSGNRERTTESRALRIGNSTRPDKKLYEQQLRGHLKFLEYAPVVFISAASGQGIEGLFQKIALVARERRKRVTTGQMNRFLAHVDFQSAPVPLNRRVKIYYITQAAVAPPTFVLFTDRDVPLHFAFERFLANQLRAAFGFIGTPLRFKTRPRNKKHSDA
jgi:GTP-binding protein